MITGLYEADEVVSVYSHVDRMVTFGCMPVNEVVPLDKGLDVWHNFGTKYVLERREIGVFNPDSMALPVPWSTILWSKKGMPKFVCIEPWHSLPSYEGGSTKREEKPAAAVLMPGEAWSTTLSTSFVR